MTQRGGCAQLGRQSHLLGDQLVPRPLHAGEDGAQKAEGPVPHTAPGPCLAHGRGGGLAEAAIGQDAEEEGDVAQDAGTDAGGG